MPLPQKVVEELNRERAATPGWSFRLLMFSGGLFFFSIFLAVGLSLGYAPYLERKSEEIDLQIRSAQVGIDAKKQDELVALYSQLENLKAILNKHVVVSPLFEWLEGHTHPSVYFTKFSLDVPERKLLLGGVAKSMPNVSEQLRAFQESSDVERVGVGNISLRQDNAWQFETTLFFSPGFFLGILGPSKTP